MQLDGSQLEGQPLATPDDCLLAEAIARKDPQVIQHLTTKNICSTITIITGCRALFSERHALL